MDTQTPKTLTVEEAARILGVGRSAAYAAANAGQIPTIRVGRRMLVPVARLRELLGESPETVNAPRLAGRDALQTAAGGPHDER